MIPRSVLKKSKTNHASRMKVMELNQGFPFMWNIVKTYSTPSLKLENMFNISEIVLPESSCHVCMCYSYIKERGEYVFVCVLSWKCS